MATPLTIAGCLRELRAGRLTARELVAQARAKQTSEDPAWILRCNDAFVEAQLARLEGLPDHLPLYGIPFAVKDNIDVAGLPTTAACPDFSYVAERHASCVQRLLDAGAVLIGKTNLDQFATGLVGTRSPYGEVPNSFDRSYVSGGSSSGSATVVARAIVPFALGTDTAGSGRVPAGFNNVVGLKPTPGLVGTNGVLPACRTLDVVSVFALTASDAARVLAVVEGPDGGARFSGFEPRAPWFREPLRVGVPRDPVVDARIGYDAAFERAVAQLQSLGAAVERIDMTPFVEVGRLLYDGPWVAERYAVVRSLLDERPHALDPAVRAVIETARQHDAVDAFRGQYRLRELAARIEPLWNTIDLLMVPTAPTLPARSAIAADPLARNAELGLYTNFVNLLGLAALAMPASITPAGLPFGVTFIAPGGADVALGAWGARWQSSLALPLGAGLGRLPAEESGHLAVVPRAAPVLPVAVVGAHLEGMPLHGQLVERGCRLLARTRTARRYRLYALPNTAPPKPGLARVDEGGVAVDVEVYAMPQSEVGSFLALIPPPLGLGSIELADGTWVKGFICEPAALHGAEDVSRFGGWRAYRSAATAAAGTAP